MCCPYTSHRGMVRMPRTKQFSHLPLSIGPMSMLNNVIPETTMNLSSAVSLGKFEQEVFLRSKIIGKKQRRCWVLTMEGQRSRWIGCEGLWTSSHGQMCIVQTAWFLHQTNFIWYFKIASIWLEDEFPFGKVSWQVRAVSVRGCAPPHNSMEPKLHQFWQGWCVYIYIYLSRHSVLNSVLNVQCCTVFFKQKYIRN